MGFFNIHSVANHQKMEGEPFGEKNGEQSLTMPKTKRGTGIVCFTRKKRKTFLVHFPWPTGAI